MPWMSRRASRYARAWLGAPVDCEEVELTLDRGDSPVPATLARPRRARAPLPGWVVLHGMTRAGRAHVQLVRFMRSLVSSGAVAIVPDVPEWRSLSLAPHLATSTVAAGIEGLRASSWVLDRPVGVIGFSFGAPHAIVASSDPAIRDHVAGTVGFGGYCDIGSTFRFMMTGVHPARAKLDPVMPDPYGRWIVGSNYLTGIPEFEERRDVAAALRELAAYSGDLGEPAGASVYDPLIRELRERLPPPHRWLFDLFAPPSGRLPDRRAAGEIAGSLARAAQRIDPQLDPAEGLGRVERPVHVLHGRGDTLISCTEAPKIRDALPSTTWSRVTITRLFGHSHQERFPVMRSLREVPRFTRALSEVLELA